MLNYYFFCQSVMVFNLSVVFVLGLPQRSVLTFFGMSETVPWSMGTVMTPIYLLPFFISKDCFVHYICFIPFSCYDRFKK